MKEFILKILTSLDIPNNRLNLLLLLKSFKLDELTFLIISTFLSSSKLSNFFIEFDKMWIHGYLHLLGYDHEEIEDEVEMFALQEKILGEWRALK